MRVDHSYDPEFTELMERLRSTHPAEVFFLEGIHPDQLDLNQASKAFFANAQADNPTADASIDPNANIGGRDTITFNYEVPKPLMKLNSLYNLWSNLRESYGRQGADSLITDAISGTLYINDAWDIGRPYCFNYSAYDIALEGLPMGGRLNIGPARSLFAFLRQVEQFTVYAANSTLGATGFADLLIVLAWYVDRIKETGKDHHITVSHGDPLYGVSDLEDTRAYIKESLTSLIYTLNWEFRGNQSPFTNVSVYDRPFLEQLVPTYVIDGRTPAMHTVEEVQDLFLEAFNEVLSRTPATFPVVTACFSTGHEDGKRHIRDAHFVRRIARHNLKFGFINLYCGESSTLSSCCRLRSSISDLGYSNNFGAGSTKIGSLGVVTLNLPRLAAVSEGSFEAFLKLVTRFTANAAALNQAKRRFIKDRIRRGALPLYSLGFMDLSRQYSTTGFTGMYEALEILNLDLRTAQGLWAAEEVLATINAANQEMSKLFGTPHNMEQVPGESSSVKLARKDELLGYTEYDLYSNQFIPLWQEGVDLLDRIRIQGRLDPHCTGGAILHLNLAQTVDKAEVMEALIHHAAEAGVVYFAVNYQINRCGQGHMTVGREPNCSVCGQPVADSFTRVVGFLTNTKHWSKTRRERDWPRRVFAEETKKE